MSLSALRRVVSVAVLLLTALVLAGCSPPPQESQSIGSLRVVGPNVFLNGARARDGASVKEGDTVTTGNGSSAFVSFRDGGFVQLDENTDPRFSFRVEVRGNLRCIHLEIQIGQVFIDKDVQCFSTPDASGNLGSRVNIRVTGSESIVTVLSGRVRMFDDREHVVEASRQAVWRRGRPLVPVRTLGPEDVAAAVRWRERYLGWCCVGERLRQTYPEQCDERRFWFDRGAAEAACRPREPLGWCCLGDGKIEHVRERDCRGAFSFDEDQARHRCAPRPRSGWCCTEGKLWESTADECRGFFSYDRAGAQHRCAPASGWCCVGDGRLIQVPERDCRGDFFLDEDQARRNCRPRVGWCCAEGKVWESSAEQCRGFFSYEQGAAQSRCTPRVGWCCLDGRTVEMTPERCRRGKGRYADTRHELGACREAVAPAVPESLRVLPIEPREPAIR